MTSRELGYVPRVLVASAGGAADRKAGWLAVALRRAGMEVVGAHRATDLAALAQTAVREEADLIALTFSCGTHLSFCRRLRAELIRAGARDLPILAGGELAPEDGPLLAELGVRRTFGADATLGEVQRMVEWMVEPKAWAIAIAPVLPGVQERA